MSKSKSSGNGKRGDFTETRAETLLPPLLRIRDVLRIVPIARSTIWLWVRQGRFPAPTTHSSITVWKRDEVLVWLAEFGD